MGLPSAFGRPRRNRSSFLAKLVRAPGIVEKWGIVVNDAAQIKRRAYQNVDDIARVEQFERKRLAKSG